MVLLKKKKKGLTVQVDYIVSVLEIKPWPPSVALCSVQTVLIQWQNGEQNSGFLPPGVSSFNGFDEGKIEFNEFFKLPVTFCTGKNDGFQKNFLEFHLYEPKKDKAIKGQLLGTAIINLAEYGIIKEAFTISAPITIKKVAKGMAQSVLYVQIQPFDNEGIESVLRLMSEQNDDDCELVSFTDDEEGGCSTSCKTPSSIQGAGNSAVQMDEMLKFINVGLNPDITGPEDAQCSGNKDGKLRKRLEVGNLESKEKQENGQENRMLERTSTDRDVFSRFSEVATTRKMTSRSTSTLKLGRKGLDLHGFGDKLKHIKSVRLPTDSPGAAAGILGYSQFSDTTKDVNSTKEEAFESKKHEKSDYKKEKKNEKYDNKGELESRIELLEEELRESAAVEIGLYSVAAEHINSKRKVHAPARRLSRFYRHACKAGSAAKRASSARTIVSGLVLVSKACGNDVSRLTFWLSNAIMLRAIVSQITEVPISAEPATETKGGKKKSEKKTPVSDSNDSPDDWQDPHTFIMALEKLEAWIFSRIVEGLWWQSFTPHMQTTTKKKKGKKLSSRRSQKLRLGLGDQEQGAFSIELWRKSIQDACERLCPIRAGGHDCGCLPTLSRSAMEQLVDRLDVAMFNAILRDSREDMPIDPVSDPITDPKVLPIPTGRSSFGAGAQLKNAVGSWSKLLSDFFGSDENETPRAANESSEEESFKAFHLLTALGDLMMLPLGMLSDADIRKEVCPTFGGAVIKRVFSNFIPDEFSPNPIPEQVLETLDSEEPLGAAKECVASFACTANPVVYTPLPAALLSTIVGDLATQNPKKGGSTILRKSHNSDDELEKLNSPLTSISTQNICIAPASSNPNWMPKGTGGRSVVRYQLLREIWTNFAMKVGADLISLSWNLKQLSYPFTNQLNLGFD